MYWGIAIEARIAIIAMTINSSIRVKPFWSLKNTFFIVKPPEDFSGFKEAFYEKL